MSVETHAHANGNGHAHDHGDHGHGDHGHELPFWRKYIFSVDHKVIGIQYTVTALVFLMFGFCLMMLMRWQLAYPGRAMPLIGKLLTNGMPGGVMLQIGIHYVDVLYYLLGPIKAVSGRFVRLVLPGDNPDVASLILEHENGALSTLNASYASASEYYLMNIYGKTATAYYDMQHGLSLLKRGDKQPVGVPCAKNDTFVEELEEFAAAVRGGALPEVGGDYATTSLAVIRAGILSAREGRRVEVAEILAKD